MTKEEFEASLQPRNHGPSGRWALVEDGVVVDMISGPESQVKIIAGMRKQKAVAVSRETFCEIGWLFTDGNKFEKNTGDKPEKKKKG